MMESQTQEYRIKRQKPLTPWRYSQVTVCECSRSLYPLGLCAGCAPRGHNSLWTYSCSFCTCKVGLTPPHRQERPSGEKSHAQDLAPSWAQSRPRWGLVLPAGPGRGRPRPPCDLSAPGPFCDSLCTLGPAAGPSGPAFCGLAFLSTCFCSQLHCPCPISMTRSLSPLCTEQAADKINRGKSGGSRAESGGHTGNNEWTSAGRRGAEWMNDSGRSGGGCRRAVNVQGRERSTRLGERGEIEEPERAKQGTEGPFWS